MELALAQGEQHLQVSVQALVQGQLALEVQGQPLLVRVYLLESEQGLDQHT